MAHAYAHLWKIPTTAFRFFTVYGPWGRPDMALFKFVAATLRGEPIDVYGRGEMKRDFTYIDDLVEAIVRLIDRPPREGEPVGADGFAVARRALSRRQYRRRPAGRAVAVHRRDRARARACRSQRRMLADAEGRRAGDLGRAGPVAGADRLCPRRPTSTPACGRSCEWYRDYYAPERAAPSPSPMPASRTRAVRRDGDVEAHEAAPARIGGKGAARREHDMALLRHARDLGRVEPVRQFRPSRTSPARGSTHSRDAERPQLRDQPRRRGGEARPQRVEMAAIAALGEESVQRRRRERGIAERRRELADRPAPRSSRGGRRDRRPSAPPSRSLNSRRPGSRADSRRARPGAGVGALSKSP